VLASVMGEQSSGRLYKALVDNKKAARVFGDTMQFNEPGLIMFGAILNKTDSLDDARSTMLATIDGVVKEPPSKEEVDRAKARLDKQIEMTLRNSEEVGLFLSEFMAMGDWRLLFRDRDILRQVTPEDVQRVAAAYLKTSNQTIGEFIPDAKPDRAEIPAKTDVATALKDYKGEAAMEAGEAFDPSPKNIESRVERYTLPSGMQVSLLRKKTRGASVHAVVNLRFGDLESLAGKSDTAALAGSTLIRGTAHKNRQQIQDEIDKLKAQLNVNGGATSASVRIETTNANLPAVLRLAGEILREATLPESEFEEVRKERLTNLDAGKTEPTTLGFTEIRRTMYSYPKGDVRGTLSIPEQIEEVKRVKLEDAEAFYKRFYGASHGQLAVVGDFDPAEVKKEIETQFGAWKSAARFERIKYGFRKIAPVNVTIETPDKQNAVFIAAARLPVSDKDADYPALVIGNYMLGGGGLNSRLAARIRVKDGLSYGVGSSLSAKPNEQDGQFQAYAIAAPQSVSKVEAAFKEEMQRALEGGFQQKELDDDRTGWLQEQHVDRSDDDSLVRMLTSRDYDGRTMAWDEELENKISALTADDVGKAVRRNIDLAQISIVKAGDFKKAATAK